MLKILRTHPEMRAISKNRARIVLVRPKPAHRGEPDDGQIVVGVHDYDRNLPLIALVDPRARRVVAVQSLPASFQLSDEERKEAETVAAKDGRVRQFLRGRRLNPLTRLYFPRGANGAATPGRYAIVFVRPSVNERRYAIVDLSTRRVTDVLTRHQLTGR
jgi:hypothetical protein